MRLVVHKDSPEGQKIQYPEGNNSKGESRKLIPHASIVIDDKKPSSKDGWVLWERYDFNEPMNLEDRLSYAYFCCGYLYYYDEITRNSCQNHSISFVWENNNKTVNILINPAPDTFDSKSPAKTGIDPQPPPTAPPPPQYS
jgi:hypothetical protein